MLWILAATDGLPWQYILVGGLVAGVVRFVWNAICWMALPHHKSDFRSMGEGRAAVEAALEAANLPRGCYYNLPSVEDYDGMKDPKYAERLNKGPNGLFVPYPKGDCMSGKTFAHGFLLNFGEGVVLALLTLVLWSNTAIPVEGCLQTLLAMGVVGLLAGSAILVARSIWMLMPWRDTRHSLFDIVVGYALMGGALYGLHGILA